MPGPQLAPGDHKMRHKGVHISGGNKEVNQCIIHTRIMRILEKKL